MVSDSTTQEARPFEEIEEGEQHTVEKARTITEADIVNFGGLSGDLHPMHVSETFAETETSFGERIAHGNLVFSITSAIAAGVNRMSFSYGYDNLRFVKPVTIGDTLTIHREVVETKDYNEDLGRVVKKYEAENQNNETVLAVEHISLVEKAGKADRSE